MDHVSKILEQWAKERPDLGLSPMGLIGRTKRLTTHLGHGMDRVFKAHGLNAASFDVLATLPASFMDYAMPRAGDLPMIGFSTEAVPSTANPMGMKGCGEAGTVGAMASSTNAVLDALWSRGVRQVDMPLTPLRTWEYLQDAAQQSR